MAVLFASFATVISFGQPTKADAPPCLSDYTSYYYSVAKYSVNPPLSTSMPLDVLVSYIALDSAARLTGTGDVDSMALVYQMNDTLKSMMKYAYEVVDYDPVRFLAYSYNFRSGLYCDPNTFRMGLNTVIAKRSMKPVDDLVLLSSDVIAKVRIVKIESLTDSAAKWARSARVIGFTILDTIKGSVIPNRCTETTRISRTGASPQTSGPTSCQYFDLRNEWAQPIVSKPVLDSALQVGRDLYVALRATVLCSDSSKVYYTFAPVWNPTLGMLGVYPVDSASSMVYIHRPVFGLSGWVTESQFLTGLSSGIHRILNP